ncbi:hypothetical protein JOM56_004526 [Amanita muscaria]
MPPRPKATTKPRQPKGSRQKEQVGSRTSEKGGRSNSKTSRLAPVASGEEFDFTAVSSEDDAESDKAIDPALHPRSAVVNLDTGSTASGSSRKSANSALDIAHFFSDAEVKRVGMKRICNTCA